MCFTCLVVVLNTSCYYVRNLSYTPTFTFQGRDGPQGAKHSNCSDSRQVSDVWCHGDIPEESKFLLSGASLTFREQKFHLQKSVSLDVIT